MADHTDGPQKTSRREVLATLNLLKEHKIHLRDSIHHLSEAIAYKELPTALSFDIIWEFLYPSENPESIHPGEALISAFLKLTQGKITLLKGAELQLHNHLRRLDPQRQLLRLFGAKLKQPSSGKHVTELLNAEINVGKMALAMLRVSMLLNADCLVPREHLELSESTLTPSEDMLRQIYRRLEHRRPNIPTNYMYAYDIASATNALDSNALIRFVTKSKLIQLEIGEMFRGESQVLNPVISPESSLFALGLKESSTDSLHSLSRHLDELEASLEDYLKKENLEGAIPHSKELDYLINAFAQFAKIHERSIQAAKAIKRSWQPPTDIVPQEINLEDLRDRLLYLAKEAHESAQTAIATYEARIGRPDKKLANTAKELKIKIDTERVYLIEPGGIMKEYSFSQTGSNITAIIDSFKVKTMVDAKESWSGSEELLKTLLKAVVDSELKVGEKEEILQSTAQVVEEVRREGSLSEVGQTLWKITGQVIEKVPDAVKAWQSLTELWS